MTSILTNGAAVAALQTLRSVNSALSNTQAQTSSGLRVQHAGDDAAYWSISTTMKSENGVLSAVADNIGLAQAVVHTTSAALDTVIQHLNEMKALIVIAASMPPADDTSGLGSYSLNDSDLTIHQNIFGQDRYADTELKKLDDRLLTHVHAIQNAVDSASFSGVNLLKKGQDGIDLSDGSQGQFVTGYANGSIQTINMPSKDFAVFNENYGAHNTLAERRENGAALDGDMQFLVQNETTGSWSYISAGTFMFNYAANGNVYKNGDVQILRNIEGFKGYTRESVYSSFLNEFEKDIQSVVSIQARLGSVDMRLEMAEKFNSTLIDSYSLGIGRLVDADMNETSTRLKALQTQAQLASQALQIANSNSESLLQLFR